MLVKSLLHIGNQAVPGDVVNIAGGQQARHDINLGSCGHNLNSRYSSPTVNAAVALSPGLIDTGIHYGHADEVLKMKFLLVNHTDDPADPLIIHIIWIIIIAQERAELVNLLIDYLRDIGADVFAFCIGGWSCSRYFMPLLHTENKSIDGPHATCFLRFWYFFGCFSFVALQPPTQRIQCCSTTVRKVNTRWPNFKDQQRRCTEAVKAFSDLNELIKDRSKRVCL